MKNSILTATVATLIAATNTVNADDSKLFQGAFVGAEVGYTDTEIDLDGAYYGANLGYRFQADSNFVFGVEGTFGKTGSKLEGSIFGQNFTSKWDYQWSAMGSVGYAFGQDKNNLISAGVGVVGIHLKTTVLNVDTKTSNTGETYFVSYERALSNNLSFRTKATTYGFATYIGTVGLAYRF